MKLKFRRGKPPLKILERGELKNIATLKMKKAAKFILKSADSEFMEANGSLITVHELGIYSKDLLLKPVVNNCPLCLQALTKDNTHQITVNGRPTAVHKTCPK